MEFLKDLLDTLVQVVLIPAIPVLATVVVKWLNIWVKEKTAEMDNKTAEKYLLEITEIVDRTVIYTSQTFVDTLKSEGKFDAESQKLAFNKTLELVKVQLSSEAKEFIKTAYSDMDFWLETKIEESVNLSKF